MKNILVTYASKHNATGEISQNLVDQLRKRGFEVDVRPVEMVKSLDEYDTVILGSAVYAGNWLKSAVAFVKHFTVDLMERDVWIFSSGPLGDGNAVELLKGWSLPDNVKFIVEQIVPHDVAVFHGRIDLSMLSFGERIIVKAVGAPSGDFRDWETIRAWADQIAEYLIEHDHLEPSP